MNKPTLVDLGEVVIEAVNSYHCRSIWPFFYTMLSVDEKEITILRVDGMHKDEKKVPIANLSSVEQGHGPLFGHVRVESRYMTTGGATIKWLWSKDAAKFTRLANEIMATAQNPDTSGGQ